MKIIIILFLFNVFLYSKAQYTSLLPAPQTWAQAIGSAFKKVTLRCCEPANFTSKERCCAYTGLMATTCGCGIATAASCIYCCPLPTYGVTGCAYTSSIIMSEGGSIITPLLGICTLITINKDCYEIRSARTPEPIVMSKDPGGDCFRAP